MERKIVLVDSSSAILLEKVDLFDFLVGVYRVIFAQAVYRELTENSYHSADLFRSFTQAEKISIARRTPETSDKEVDAELNSLNVGERETIQLYREGIGDFILLDDGKGARYCHKCSLPFINALLFPKILRSRGLITEEECREKTVEIIGIGRYSNKIVRMAAEMTDINLVPFLPAVAIK